VTRLLLFKDQVTDTGKQRPRKTSRQHFPLARKVAKTVGNQYVVEQDVRYKRAPPILVQVCQELVFVLH